MHRKTSIDLISLQPRPNSNGREWLATFRLVWAEDRQMLAVGVTANDRLDAERQAKHAVAAHLQDLAHRLLRETEMQAALVVPFRRQASATRSHRQR